MRLLKIGRDTTCDIVLHSDRVSSLHAELTLMDNGDIQLEDKNSSNGTFLMNHRIAPGKPVNVRRGDTIRFADTELQWQMVPMPDDNSAYKAIFGVGSNFNNDIQISGATVSRYHATIKLGRDGKMYIVDHSKNGTTVDGSRIIPNTPFRIKKNSAVVCGGVPVDTSRLPWPTNVWGTVLAIAATIIVVAGIGFGIWWITRPKLEVTDLTPATVYVYGEYYLTVHIENDQIPNLLAKYDIEWPSEYYVYRNKKGDWCITGSREEIMDNLSAYSGTAFFIDRSGNMGTNRHIAVPWEYIESDETIAIQGVMEELRNKLIPVAQITNMDELSLLGTSSILGKYLHFLCTQGYCSLNEVRGYINNFKSNKIKITGRHTFMAVGYPNRNYNSTDEFERCTVVKESGDANIDVAIIQLNSYKTPDNIKYLFDINNARTDISTLKPQKEDLITIGYPAGLRLGLDNEDGGLKPTIHKVRLSKEPGHYSFQFQGEELGGASGSPIIDEKGKLVGVLWGGLAQGGAFGWACEIKYLKQLYDNSSSEGSKTRINQPYMAQ